MHVRRSFTRIASLAVFLGLLFPGVGGAEAPATAGTLEIVVHGTERGGVLNWAVFDSAAGYDDEDALRGGRTPAGGPATKLSLGTLEPGRYAVSIFLDVDEDGEFDSNFVGMPTEPFGFSNDAKMRFGKPGFDAASFDLGPDGIQMEVHLIQL